MLELLTKPLSNMAHGGTGFTQNRALIDIFIQFQSQELLFMKKLFECLSPSFVFPGVQGMVHLLLLAVPVSDPSQTWMSP